MRCTTSGGSSTNASTQRHHAVRDAPIGDTAAEHGEKPLRPLEADDASGVADDLREIERRVTRTASDVDDAIAGADAGAAPRIEHAQPPRAMLQAEAFDLRVMRAEHVVLFGHRAASGVRRRASVC
jgi:hypothetical protein